MDNLKKGSIPSVAKVQMLADYLGVTTSELLGETLPTSAQAPDILQKWDKLSSEDQEEIQLLIEMKLTRQKRSNQKRLD